MRINATMRALDQDRGVVRVEDVYDTSIEDLWQACTSPERLARWIAEVTGDLRLGGEVHAVFTSTWSGQARIDSCDAPSHAGPVHEDGWSEHAPAVAWRERWSELTAAYRDAHESATPS